MPGTLTLCNTNTVTADTRAVLSSPNSTHTKYTHTYTHTHTQTDKGRVGGTGGSHFYTN